MAARLLLNLNLAGMTPHGPPYGLVRDAAIVVGGDARIAWSGPAAELHRTRRLRDIPEVRRSSAGLARDAER